MKKALETTKLLFKLFVFILFCFPLISDGNPVLNKNGKKIEIIIPPCGSLIPSKKVKSGEKVEFTAKGNSLNLSKGEYITLLIKKADETIWQRISTSVKVESDHTGLWTINADATIKKNFQEGEIIAIVTKSPISKDEISAVADSVSIPFMCLSSQGHTIKTAP